MSQRFGLSSAAFLTVAVFGVGAGIVNAAPPELHVRCGLGGLYRSGTWMPVTAQLSSVDTETVAGQLQVFQTPTYGTGNAFFARPISLAPSHSTQSFTLMTRDLDPVRDEATVRVMADGHEIARSMLAEASGTSVGERDLLLVGLGGDASTFSFLDGQSWNVEHTSGGPRKIITAGDLPDPQARIASASVSELPDKTVGYSGVDAFLLRSDAPLASLTDAKMSALKSWVAAGGELIVCAGNDASRFDDPFFSDLLPADVAPISTNVTLPDVGSVACLTLTPKSAQGAQILNVMPSIHPLAVAGVYGAGHVILTAIDPTTLPFRSWHGVREPAFWQTLLLADQNRSISVLGYVAHRQETPARGLFTSMYAPYLAHIVMPYAGSGVDLVRLLGVFFAVYIIVIIPVTHWLLKSLKKRDWAWRVIPGLALIFAIGGTWIGVVLPGGTLSVNRASFLETASGQHLAGCYQEVGVIAQHRVSAEIVFPTSTGAATMSRRITRPWRGRGGDPETPQAPTPLIQTDTGMQLQNVALSMGGAHTFDVQSTVDLAGSVNGILTRDTIHHRFSSTVTNHLSVNFSHCAVYYDRRWTPMNDLKTGQSAMITSTLSSRKPAYNFVLPTGGPDFNWRQMEMANYLQSLEIGLRPSDSGFSPVRDEPSPNEALFIGWTDDTHIAGPAVRVSNQDLPAKDTTLVIVHIPVDENVRRGL